MTVGELKQSLESVPDDFYVWKATYEPDVPALEPVSKVLRWDDTREIVL